MLFIFERRKKVISTWIQPVNAFSIYKQNCTCDEATRKHNQECIVMFNNKLYEYSLEGNTWYNHSCSRHGDVLDNWEMMMNTYGDDERDDVELSLDLINLGETVKAAMLRCNLTKNYMDGTLC